MILPIRKVGMPRGCLSRNPRQKPRQNPRQSRGERIIPPIPRPKPSRKTPPGLTFKKPLHPFVLAEKIAAAHRAQRRRKVAEVAIVVGLTLFFGYALGAALTHGFDKKPKEHPVMRLEKLF